jgi:hypothetical protein
MGINWEVVKPSLWTGAGGVFVGMVLLSYGFGFMSRTTAEKLANTSSERAVIAVMAPVCADSSVRCRMLPHEQRLSWQTRTIPTKCARHSQQT